MPSRGTCAHPATPHLAGRGATSNIGASQQGAFQSAPEVQHAFCQETEAELPVVFLRNDVGIVLLQEVSGERAEMFCHVLPAGYQFTWGQNSCVVL